MTTTVTPQQFERATKEISKIKQQVDDEMKHRDELRERRSILSRFLDEIARTRRARDHRGNP